MAKDTISEVEAEFFYQHHNLDLLPNPGFRQYRMELPDGRFVVLRSRVQTPEQLHKLCLKYKPKNIYQSTSCWLNPLKVRGYKHANSLADKIVLSHNVLVDIDLKGEEGACEARKALNFFKDKPRYKLLKILSTGGGYHLIYEDLEQKSIADPAERFEWIKKERSALKEEMIKAGIEFDTQVLDDLFRVSRVPGSYNGNKGKPCVDISDSFKRPLKGGEKNACGGKVNFMGQSRNTFANPQAIPPPRIDRFVSNKVPGLKDKYIPVLVWNEGFNYRSILAKRYVRKLRLGKLYIFKFDKWVYGISLKTVSAVRLSKILELTKSINFNSWTRYGHCWIYLGRKRFDNPDVAQTVFELAKKNRIQTIARTLEMQKPELLECLEMSEQSHYISRPHGKAIEFLTGFPIQNILVHGDEYIKEHMVLR